ncbi:hypothetical protein LAZ40_03430 [Cereibacter sphaeroides]|uniref:hypothetical protein n=1 Tax=Cereibacter sphaeroides TaxID=1063 RepID=UPI001F1FBC37|nr:hypothetical protein [Cereibacter sphaeroides]MCE6958107.1 hypothetical protein [Cereibacter sphaeroides]MCE6971656.1 hypothetical protein [Cereibacter sphaeroides]
MRFISVAISLVLIACSSACLAAATCLEPVRPDRAFLEDAGFSPAEIRTEYRTYFTDVEDFLNCLNDVAARVRTEARTAAYDFDRALKELPQDRQSLSGSEDGFAPSTVPLQETGRLFLSQEDR